ncbi:oligosaccharide flippase family protein [Maribacter sp. SA7]|uniref:oligosaccharide flippase family protein n=1 Tax=Maribacter zhoushanensis TaxID=3030012 RepID=UPI0023EC6966|nr:oligosaccharide flippase family protein [Maribacter zhoushanensis]MDF4201841.1 oligosaccharide flippase family protein [Maribacter zhoushanensis]
MKIILNQIKHKFSSKIFKNSIWGVLGSLTQNILLSLFYILIARHYSIDDFSEYLIANSLYQMIVAFSAMGLGHWFIREIVNTENKTELAAKFLKMQAYFGFLFLLVNIILALMLYENTTVQKLSILFSINIIFDNIIYSIKNINIAQFAQKKTVTVLSIEAFAKFGIASLLFFYPFNIVVLTVILIIIRFITLNLFLKIGSADGIKLTGFWKVSLSFDYIKTILSKYWPFAIIGSAYVIYWKSSTLIISKMLPLSAVAHYENSFKIFSLAQLVPVVLSSTLLPKFVEYSKNNDTNSIKSLYNKIFLFCTLYGLAAFTFTYSFADEILPFIFGDKYASSAVFTKEMFLTMLVFPTSLVQANILISLKLEKLDMWFNINSIIINITLCMVGLYFWSSLSVVNYSIFISFIVFHISQDIVLLKNKLISWVHILLFIVCTTSIVLTYISISKFVPSYIIFIGLWLTLGIIGFLFFGQRNKMLSSKIKKQK